MRIRWSICGLVFMAAVIAASPAFANVYASGLQQTGPTSFSYILNENADNGVTIQLWKVGGGLVNSYNLGPQAKGLQSFTWDTTGSTGGLYTAKVVASDDGYGSWTKISADETTNNYYVPVGINVNKNQSSPNFGTVYVSNATAGTTAAGRNTLDGLFANYADSSFRASGTAGVTWSGASSPHKLLVGEDDKVYVADLSNDLSFEVASDLSSAVQLTDASNRTANQWVRSIWVEGTQAGGDRKIYLVNSNYNDTARKGLIEYNLGSAAKAATNDTGTQVLGPSYWTYYPYDVTRDSAGNWYLTTYRGIQSQAPCITKFDANGNVLWEASSTYYYADALDINESAGYVAYGHYNTGEVLFFDINTGQYLGVFDAGSRMRDIAFDAAGNLYTVDNLVEYARVWSPPTGANSFTTETYFTLVPEPSSMLVLLAGLPTLLLRRKR